MTRHNLCFIDRSSNVENDLGGTGLAGMNSNQDNKKEVKDDYSMPTLDDCRRKKVDETDGLKNRTL